MGRHARVLSVCSDRSSIKLTRGSVPTWGNHRKIFTHAGLTVCEYRYVNFKNQTLDLEGMLADLSQAEPGSIVLLHACAHNPSGEWI